MSDDVLSKHKLADAIPHPLAGSFSPVLNGMPEQNHTIQAEQQREAAENEKAHHAQGGIHERLNEIGKANHRAGHGHDRASDQS